MASQITVVEMVQTLAQTGLVPPERLQQLQEDVQQNPPEPLTLVRMLQERGWLTAFQAERLADGRLLLGSYVLLERLGEGGMGEVYKARHLLLDRLVALKILRHDHVRDADMAARFLREIKLAASLHHPHIVQVYDAGQAGEIVFYTMEYLAGENLARVVKKNGPLEPHLACEYVCQAALGLEQVHHSGMVHRDMKPSNLMLVPQQSIIKVLDLGLAFRPATPESGDADSLTVSSIALGTVDYIAPEQVQDSHGVDIRADIYSLGCTLYFLLAGRPPFPEGTRHEKHVHHLEHEPEKIETLCPALPAELPPLLRKMMAKKPGDRFQTPKEVVAALGSFCTRDSKTSLFGSTQVLHPRRRSRRRVAGIALLCALVAGGIALAYFLLHRSHDAVLPPEQPIAGTWIVSRKSAPADHVFRTIQAALEKAKPGDRILLRDERHEERLEIVRARGVTVEGQTLSGRPVVWRAPWGNAKPILRLNEGEDFALVGIVLDGQSQVDDLVHIEGDCPGLKLEKVRCQGFGQAAIRLRDVAGTLQKPVQFLELQVKPPGVSTSALVFEGRACRHLEVRDGVFTGPFASIFRIAATLQQVRFERNRLFQAKDGLQFQSTRIDPSTRLELTITSNTFCSVHHALRIEVQDLVEKKSKLEVVNNLFAKTTKLAQAEGGHSPLAKNAVWVAPPDNMPPGPRYFRATETKMTKMPVQAFWEIYCDDQFEAWWNGIPVGGSQPGQRFYRFNVLPCMQAKRSFEHMAIKCENRQGRAGFLSQFVYDRGGGAKAMTPFFRLYLEGKPDWQVSDGKNVPCRLVAVAPLAVTAAVGNVCDGASGEGSLQLKADVSNVKFLSEDPAQLLDFLRYARTSPLAKAGIQGQPVGVPPPN